MMLVGATAPPVETGDPTWYLIWDVAGTWAGAIATAAATIVALAFGVRAAKEQQAQREAQDRVQAEQVTLTRHQDAGRSAWYELHNNSDLPISNARVLGEGTPEHNLHPVESIRAQTETVVGYDGAKDQGNLAVAEFDDAIGRSWIRTTDGRLHRVIKAWSESSLRARCDSDGIVQQIFVRPRPGVVPVLLRKDTIRTWSPGSFPSGRRPHYMLVHVPQLWWRIRKSPDWREFRETIGNWAEADLIEFKDRIAARREARRERWRYRQFGK